MFLIRKIRKPVCTFLALVMCLTIVGSISAAQSNSDISGHWAEEKLQEWINSGNLTGYEDGSIKPERKIKRSEIVALINRSFDLTGKADIAFTDLNSSNWAYEEVAVAVDNGYVKGYKDGTFRPNHNISREEAAVMIATLLKLKHEQDTPLSFDDASEVASWSQGAVAVLSEKGIIKGYTDGRFGPKDKLTRAQAVMFLDNAIQYSAAASTIEYSEKGTYGPEAGIETINGDVVISMSGVTLRNMIINGNLSVAEGVGEGDVYLKSVTVNGTTTVNGGGPNSIHLEDSILLRILIDKRDGIVRIVALGNSSIEYIIVKTPVILKESGLTDSGFANVELSNALPAGSKVELEGVFENISILSSNIKLNIPSGTINHLSIDENAGSNEITLDKNASILKLVLDAVANLLGEGKIETAVISNFATGSSFVTKPSKVEGAGFPSVVAPNPPSGGGVILPEPTPEVPACEDTIACAGAAITNLSISGDYVLNQLDASYQNIGETGFTSDVLGYAIVTDRNKEKETATVKVNISDYATGIYAIDTSGNADVRHGIIENGQAQFDVTVYPDKDTKISFFIESGNEKNSKHYIIYFQYPRTIQEGMKLVRMSSDASGEDWNEYSLQMETILGERVGENFGIEIYKSSESEQPIATCSGEYSCYIPEKIETKTIGKLYVKIYKEDILFIEGDYQYDLTLLPELENDVDFHMIPLTKQELIEAFLSESFFMIPFSHGYDIHVDTEKIKENYPDAVYYTWSYKSILSETSSYPLALEKDGVKVGLGPDHYPLYGSTIVQKIQKNKTHFNIMGSTYYHQVENDNDNHKKVNDEFGYFTIFDANYTPIGYFVTVTTFDEDHMAEGYTPNHTWKGN